eukprot:139068-Prorocentrum_minimum.AAC.1
MPGGGHVALHLAPHLRAKSRNRRGEGEGQSKKGCEDVTQYLGCYLAGRADPQRAQLFLRGDHQADGDRVVDDACYPEGHLVHHVGHNN